MGTFTIWICTSSACGDTRTDCDMERRADGASSSTLSNRSTSPGSCRRRGRPVPILRQSANRIGIKPGDTTTIANNLAIGIEAGPDNQVGETATQGSVISGKRVMRAHWSSLGCCDR
jgi:hypothetical protein